MPNSFDASTIRLKLADAERYVRLRQRMLANAPWAYSASPSDDVALDLARVAERLADEHAATFAIEAPGGHASQGQPELIAAAGILRAKPPKFAHRATLWGVFVEPSHRGKGLGRAVVTEAIETARTWPGVVFIDLGVSANAPEAQRLYESLGFEKWGREPESTEHEGRRYDEIYMALRLGAEAGSHAASIRRVVPNVPSDRIEESRRFYTELFGFEVAMDMGWIMTLASPSNRTAQINLVSGSASSPGQDALSMSIEVADVDEVHAKAIAGGLRITYPLTTEAWGVRRFGVTDPNGVVINVMSHRK